MDYRCPLTPEPCAGGTPRDPTCNCSAIRIRVSIDTVGGGPGDSTSVLALYMMNNLGGNRAGFAIAIAIVLTVITLAQSLLVLRLFGHADD